MIENKERKTIKQILKESMPDESTLCLTGWETVSWKTRIEEGKA